MKFKDLLYFRPDLNIIKSDMCAFTDRLISSESYGEAKAVFLEKEAYCKHISSLSTIAMVRNSIDTTDEYYDSEAEFWDAADPALQELEQKWSIAMLDSKWRYNFTEEYGNLMFKNTEISLKTFSSEIADSIEEENRLTREYEKLLASAQISFEDGVYTLSQLSPMKNDQDDERRHSAWKAEGAWFNSNQSALDTIYDKLVSVRDSMGKKLGYSGYTQLGYYRMGRNCYDENDIKKFRKAVIKYIVPVAAKIYKNQAARIAKEYPMNYADNALAFRSGNPKPLGNAESIISAGKKFYDNLSAETAEFFSKMLDCEMMDLISTKGKSGGGYCCDIPDSGMPFIFANFNGTQGDVDVITHEAGHAFEAYINRDRIPASYVWPSMEACEVHSMSMEFFGWQASEDFFGPDSEKYRYSHLSSALTFIPYGTLVDHFQHEVYASPSLTPDERHAVWKNLMKVYMPWVCLDDEIPFYGEGHAWQRQHHIYQSPFYYIDYCLAQTVSLYFWSLIQNDPKMAWEKYMAYTNLGGSATFTELLEKAGLISPFDEEALKDISEKASLWLDNFDLSSIR